MAVPFVKSLSPGIRATNNLEVWFRSSELSDTEAVFVEWQGYHAAITGKNDPVAVLFWRTNYGYWLQDVGVRYGFMCASVELVDKAYVCTDLDVGEWRRMKVRWDIEGNPHTEDLEPLRRVPIAVVGGNVVLGRDA